MGIKYMGYLFAFLSSIFFGLYIVPRKLVKLPAIIFSFYMALGFSISSLVLYACKALLHFQEPFSWLLIWSVLAGIIWATAFVNLVKSIDYIGLSKSNQWKNLQGPIAVFCSLLFLHETRVVNTWLVILAALIVFLSALAFTINEAESHNSNIRGVLFAIYASVGFGVVATIQKYVTVHVGIYSQQLVWSVSIVCSLFCYIAGKRKGIAQLALKEYKSIILSMVAGLLYLGASVFQLVSYKYLPATISFTIIQLNAFWVIFIGILVFKEINFKKHYVRVIVGLLLTALAMLFLAYARR